MLLKHISARARAPLFYTSCFNIHTVGKSASQITKGEPPVVVYNSKEYDDLAPISRGSKHFANSVANSPHASKYLSLIPFHVESLLSNKCFVLRMELYPTTEYLKFYTLTMGGVRAHFEPLKYVIPVSKYDYWGAQYILHFKQVNCLDLEMIYANYASNRMYVFDKNGEWRDEGVYHEKLSLENTYNETNWFDEFIPHNL